MFERFRMAILAVILLLSACGGPNQARPAAVQVGVARAPTGGAAPAPAAMAPSQPTLRSVMPLDAALQHRVAVLQRLSFGVNGHLLDLVDAQGGERAWLEAQLRPGSDDGLPDDVARQVQGFRAHKDAIVPLVLDIERKRKDARILPDEAQRKAVLDGLRETANQMGREAQLELLWRETYTRWQLQELMTAFWLNHFSVFQAKSDVQLLAGDYINRAIRPNVFGSFRKLLQATARHPAMLRYLDNDRNAAGKLNENFARELLELHTLGVDGGYTQKDVQELARVLTGFGVQSSADPLRPGKPGSDAGRREGLLEYAPARHDFADKMLLGERLHSHGWAEFDEVLDRLARHPATIHHVSVQLATFLLGAAPDAELLEHMRATWVASDGDLRRLMLVVIDSPQFAASLQQGFKGPQRYVVSALRLAYEDRPVLNLQPALNWLNRMQQAPLARVTPDGYPLLSAAWMGSGQFATRFDIARQLGYGSVGLFRQEGSKSEEQPAFPQLATPFYYRAIEPGLSEGTRQSLSQARSPQEWTLLLLASPELMRY